MSPWLPLAALAAEDRRFFKHPGVDLKAVARAAWQNASSGRTVSGASTITQQLARALQPRPKTIAGKLREMFSALSLERAHGKPEILEAYLNSVSFGNLNSGVQAAARAYFGVAARDLTLAQAAALAGLPRSPLLYDPLRRPAEFAARGRFVLRRMLALGYIDGEAYRLAAKEPLKVLPQRPAFEAPHFCAWLRAGEPGRAGELASTLDLGVQEAAAQALRSQVGLLKRRQNVRNGAVLALDNATGAVLAWAGSADFFDEKEGGQVDGVLALRQPGSALKPFLYALAFARGARPADLLADEPYYAAGGYAPLNYDKKYHGKVRLREALACSYNIPAVRLAEQVGVPAFHAYLRQAGFASLDKPAGYYGSGLALGNGEVTLLELTNAYAALARGGLWLPLRADTAAAPARPRRIMGREEAFLVTDILSDNAARTPAFGPDSPFRLPFPFAAKTGTTKDYRDNWAVGYTPEWTVGVWVGNFDGSPMRKSSGITGAAPVLRQVALYLHERYGSSGFRQPPQFRRAPVCAESGLQPGPACTSVLDELYLPAWPAPGLCRLHGAAAEPGSAPQKAAVKYPAEGDIFRIDPNTPLKAQAVFLKASADEPGIAWKVDGRELPGRGPIAAWPLAPGRHTVSFALPGGGKAPPVRFTVLR